MNESENKNGVFSRKWYLFGFIPVWKETRIVNYSSEISAAEMKKEILGEINDSLGKIVNPDSGR